MLNKHFYTPDDQSKFIGPRLLPKLFEIEFLSHLLVQEFLEKVNCH